MSSWLTPYIQGCMFILCDHNAMLYLVWKLEHKVYLELVVGLESVHFGFRGMTGLTWTVKNVFHWV